MNYFNRTKFVADDNYSRHYYALKMSNGKYKVLDLVDLSEEVKTFEELLPVWSHCMINAYYTSCDVSAEAKNGGNPEMLEPLASVVMSNLVNRFVNFRIFGGEVRLKPLDIEVYYKQKECKIHLILALSGGYYLVYNDKILGTIEFGSDTLIIKGARVRNKVLTLQFGVGGKLSSPRLDKKQKVLEVTIDTVTDKMSVNLVQQIGKIQETSLELFAEKANKFVIEHADTELLMDGDEWYYYPGNIIKMVREIDKNGKLDRTKLSSLYQTYMDLTIRGKIVRDENIINELKRYEVEIGFKDEYKVMLPKLLFFDKDGGKFNGV